MGNSGGHWTNGIPRRDREISGSRLFCLAVPRGDGTRLSSRHLHRSSCDHRSGASRSETLSAHPGRVRRPSARASPRLLDVAHVAPPATLASQPLGSRPFVSPLRLHHPVELGCLHRQRVSGRHHHPQIVMCPFGTPPHADLSCSSSESGSKSDCLRRHEPRDQGSDQLFAQRRRASSSRRMASISPRGTEVS